MKLIVTSSLILLLYQICFCQRIDTIRVYNHLKPGDTWRLRIKNSKSFTLYAELMFNKNEFVINGKCKLNDSTIQFLGDTSKLKRKSLTHERIKRFSNLPYIVLGDRFTIRKNIFVPHNINYNPNDSFTVPKGVFASYYRGDGFGSNIIELKEDSTYIFHDNSCVARFKEEGTWTLNNNLLTFQPKDNKWSMLEWFTNDMKLYLEEDYLIGKKTTKTFTKSNTTIVTETFSYLSKQPVYLND